MYSTSTALIQISFIVVFLAFSFEAKSQVIQKERFEVALGNLDPGFDILPADQSGLFLYRLLLAEKTYQLELYQLDTALQTNWHGYIPVNVNYRIIASRMGRQSLFILLQHQEFRKRDFQLLVINPKNGEYLQHSIRNYISFAPHELRITSKAAIIGGYYNNIPVVLYYSFNSRSSKVLPGLFNEAGVLNQVQINKDDSFDVIISARNPRKQQTIFIKNYDQDGNILQLVPVSYDGMHLMSARSLKENRHDQIVAGTFGKRNSEFSRGVFFGRIDDDGAKELSYYHYGELENFFTYMRPKQEKRVKERILRREAKGKKTKFNYRLQVHEIVPYKDHYVMLGEAYYPRYLTRDVTFGAQAILTTPSFYRSGRIFDGYRYTHALVIGFDKSGRRLWDNAFEINDVKRFSLDQFVKLDLKQDRMTMLYLHENDIRTKVIDRNKVLEPKKAEPLNAGFSPNVQRPKRTSGTNLNYWYLNFLTASGIQDVGNFQSGERRVFFINKVHFRPQAFN